MVYVTLTTLLRWFVIQKLGFYTFYLYAKFYDSSFSRFSDIIGGLKI